MIGASRARFSMRSVSWCASACMPSRAATRMGTMRADWAVTRSKSCSVVATRSVARSWPRSRRSRGSRMHWIPVRSTGWGWHWPRQSLIGTAGAWGARSSASRSIWIRPTIRPMARSSSRSSIGHYDTWCYLPVAGFLTFTEEPEQYLFAYVLRPGNAGASVGALGILSRLVPRLRAAFPQARLRVRLDGGFAAPQIFAFLEREGLEYAVAMGKNKVLERRAARLMGTARRLSRESGETEHLYKECRYAAGTWDQPRRVIIKAEVVRHPGRKPKNNPRFVVTNLKQSPRHLYEVIYCARANIENRIKELHHGLEIDRTSCTRFLAN